MIVPILIQIVKKPYVYGINNGDSQRLQEQEGDNMKIAVIAGTQVDTRMGVDYVEHKNAEAGERLAEPVFLPVTDTCDDQIKFQYSGYEDKRRRMDEIFDAAGSEGVQAYFIYCNSLSGAFDFDKYSKERDVKIVTPLQIYRELGKRYRRIGFISANNLSAHNIEKHLMSQNEELYAIGSGNMAIVSAIEAGRAPSDIVRELGLDHMVQYMEACGCEALLLGCTHFPYIKEELEKICTIPVIDPADEMFAAVMAD